jgi:hypothetical protein
MKQKEENKTIDIFEQNVKTYPLSSIIEEDQEEAHYVQTINAFVELIVVYGYDKVIGDLRTAMGNKTW